MKPTVIFVNLPVADVKAATAFYEAIGATRDPRFSDETTSGMSFSANIIVMLLETGRFRSFVPENKTISNATQTTEVLLCVQLASKEEVDEVVETAAKSGGKGDPTKLQEMEGMYGRSFEDPDGHIWELGYMNFGEGTE
ncbi:Glyoxalase/Bleomycin resistance protein/Dihydroxybiphenyl dioxygenase [Patellaria atrata CBS 101060]|uniref:Glyoxalase/Bleomycin resistance protein/Dihydroxybiphenyl dioxygenase n=1 Tax=Patellaria atrata CBS 101060 TaxID=1346257 RepID=A0A9P4VM66_9PEZI|nr:Glyoxalase/Bleomycin resistance protein/Dihydroxybiphenyl dioxygenase [Patellaria atrata CBS 101060]